MMHRTLVIDYGTPSTNRSEAAFVFTVVRWLRRHWLPLIVALGIWLALGRWRAGVLTRQSVTLGAPMPAWDLNGTGVPEAWILSSFGDEYVPHFEAKVMQGRVGKITWTPRSGAHVSGHPTHRGSNANSSFWDDIPSGCLPAVSGPLTITYTLEVTAWPNPWRSFLYFGSATETVERSVTITVPGRTPPVITGPTVGMTAPAAQQ